MAVLTLTIPDAQVQRLVAAVAQQRGVDISALTTAQKIALVKTDVVTYWLGILQAAEMPGVVTTAQAARLADIAANLTVT